LYRGWLGPQRADELLAAIRARTVWLQERRKMYDRFVDVPREQAWFGEDRERPFTPELDAVRRALEALTGARFSHVLLNRYRNGNDSVAWHHDREVDHLQRPVIASLTLGATRAFDLRPKSERSKIVSIDLDHGDLLVMRGDTQTNWEHRVAKNPRIAGERINLTFRQQPD
jgi:alkylated DNA repair dioxygenase AlkB